MVVMRLFGSGTNEKKAMFLRAHHPITRLDSHSVEFLLTITVHHSTGILDYSFLHFDRPFPIGYSPNCLVTF